MEKAGHTRGQGRSETEDLSDPLIAHGVDYAFMEDGLTGWDLKSGAPVFDLPSSFDVDVAENRMGGGGSALCIQ